jgi:hypothetical protein
MSRPVCRGCGTSAMQLIYDGIAKPPEQPRTYLEAAKGSGTTRQKAECTAKISAFESMLRHVGEDPHLAEHRAAIEADIQKLQKKCCDTRSTAKQIDHLETWLGREQKRVDKLAADLEEATKVLQQRREDLGTETTKLALLKQDLAKEEENKVANKDTDKDVHMDTPEAEAETHKLVEKELTLRRKLARKRDTSGLTLNGKQLKDMEKEADDLSGRIEKRRKTKAKEDGT